MVGLSLAVVSTNENIMALRKKMFSCNDVKEFCELAKQVLSIIGDYCVYDSVICIELAENLHMWQTMEALANIMCVPMSYLHTRGQQIRVLAQVYRKIVREGIIIPYNPRSKDDEVAKKSYEGATVIEAIPGHYSVGTFDFSAMYPCQIIEFNISPDTFVPDSAKWPETAKLITDEECNIIDFSSHRGCEHDIRKHKTKVKKENILCNHHRYRFLKVIHDGENREREGIYPKILRALAVERKTEKKIMAECEAMIKMNKGLADDKDMGYYKKMGWRVIKKAELQSKEIFMFQSGYVNANSRQLALKVSMNSTYGSYGVANGAMIPLMEGAASVTAMGRQMIGDTVDFINKNWPIKVVYGDSVTADTPVLCRLNGKVFYSRIDKLPNTGMIEDRGKLFYTPTDGLEVWSDKGFTKIVRIISHETHKTIYNIVTDSSSVCVTEDHSLLDDRSKEISPKDVRIGTKLLHCDIPRGHLTPSGDESLSFAESYYEALRINIQFTDKIIEIKDLGSGNGQIVYDLETENHHFAAGIGRLVVHNTDSCMADMPKDMPAKDVFAMGDDISKKVVHYLRCKVLGVDATKPGAFEAMTAQQKLAYNTSPIDLVFENYYKSFVLLTKKRYIAYTCNRDNAITGMVKKGVVTVRRDNCQFVRDVYKDLSAAILDRKGIDIALDIIHKGLRRLYGEHMNEKNLIVYAGLNDIIEYAKKDKTKKHHVDSEGEIIPDVLGPNDPRLVYPNLPQVKLGVKMLRRGDQVPANTRLEMIFLKYDGDKVGDKVEDYTYYRDNRTNPAVPKPDLMMYVENKFTNPVVELIVVAFPGCDGMLRSALSRQTKLDTVLAEQFVKYDLSSIRTMKAKVDYVLNNVAASDKPVKGKFNMKTHKDLIVACKSWRSKQILEKLYKQHNVKPTIRTTRKKFDTAALAETYIECIAKYHELYRLVVDQMKVVTETIRDRHRFIHKRKNE
jgi:DNA polymerase elongation subunit (family B)